MSPLRQLAVLAVVGAAAVAAWLADLPALLGRESAETLPAARSASERPPVVVEPVAFASDAAVVEAVGTGMAVQSVTLHPEAAGRVTAVLFSAGQAVEAGAPLLRLDDEEEKLAIELARVRLEDARQRLARFEQAAPSGAVSITEVDAARTALAAARIELAQAELALRHRTLVAPFAGVVGIPAIDVGDRVTESTAITTLDDRSAILIEFDVPEVFSSGLRRGDALTATTWALPGLDFAGEIDAVGSRIDDETRTLRVRARIPNEGDRLRTGMSFVVRLPLTGDRFPSVPSIAVQWDRKGAYVWSVRNGVAERVMVRVLKRSDRWVLVDAPLRKDDRIVVEGVQRLRPGVEVQVQAAGDIAAADPADGS